jgi:hypothetical protein
MIHSQEIALRCAAALPRRMLFHRQRNPWKEFKRDTTHKPLAYIKTLPARQLEACADDEARRIILGCSR